MSERTKRYARVLIQVLSERYTLPENKDSPKNNKPSKIKKFTPEEQALAEEFSDLLDKFDEEEKAPDPLHTTTYKHILLQNNANLHF